MADETDDGLHLPATFHLWPDEQHGPWLLRLFWQVVDGRAECVGMSLTSAKVPVELESAGSRYPGRPPIGTPLTTNVLRQLKVSERINADRSGLVSLLRDQDAALFAGPGVRRSTLDRLREASEVYREAWRDGRPPTKAVAEHFGVSNGAASNLVARARAVGLLPPTSAGVAAGSAEPSAVKLEQLPESAD